MYSSLKRHPIAHAFAFLTPTTFIIAVVSADIGFDLALLYVLPFVLVVCAVFAVVGYYVSRLVARLLGLDPWL